MICDIYDDVLEPHVAELIQSEIKKVPWHYYYSSNKKVPGYHWHVYCGQDSDQVTQRGYDFLLPIWEVVNYKYQLEEKYGIIKWKRLYMNAHTFGIEPNMHHDDGDFTMMYYPRLDWKPEWMGGTAIWGDEGKNIDRYCNYIGNRILLFPAKNKHQAMSVSRFCHELRPVVVFKLYVKDMNLIEEPNSDRLDFYKD